MIISKISSKGQVTIPKKIREILNIDVSGKIGFTLLENGKVLITSEQNSAKMLFGILKHRKPSKAVPVEEMKAAVRERRCKRILV
jgi:AbrB family looped-hinge helix DNA binding protein